ncbi:hypothetical protein VPH35_113855 [Triticum aestivum]
MILRNSEGEVIFASCSYLSSCASALEAKVAACREGISLTLEWSMLPFILETDCSIALSMLKGIEEAKHMLSLGRQHELTHVRRGLNRVSHALAPEHILALCKLDCNAPG